MARSVLAKLLAQPRVRAALGDVLQAPTGPLAVLDVDGTVLAGASAAGTRHPVEAGGATLGFVCGGSEAPGVARLLGLVAAEDNDKREVAREGVQKYKELALLYDVSEKIGACLDIDDTAGLVLAEVRRIIRKGAPQLVLRDAGDETLSCRGEAGPCALPPALEPFLRELMAHGRPEIVNSTSEDPRLGGASAVARSLMAVPLSTRGATLGTLLVLCDTPVEFRSDELRLLTALATLCASSLEKARLYQKIARETRLRSHFQRYLSPTVVEDILANRTDIALGGKNVECSVLFSDLCGFTSLTEERSPEQIIGLLNEYFTVMAEVVLRHGGTLDKFIGDAIMAVFGAPCALPDAHLTALQVAVEMHQALHRLQWKWLAQGWPAVQHRVGVNTGHVIAGNIGSEQRMDYTVIGDAVNLAARVESLSPPMHTTISHQTFEKLRDRVMTRCLPAVQVKGKVHPVLPHLVLAVRGEAPGTWSTAFPLHWQRQGVAGGWQPGTLVAIGEEELLIETATAPEPDAGIVLRPAGEAAGADDLCVGAWTVQVSTEQDAAANGFFRCRIEVPTAELPPPLRRIRDAIQKQGAQRSWMHA